MSSRQLRGSAVLLRQRPHGEKFSSLAFLSAEHGMLHSLSRQSNKPTFSTKPDLYDQANVILEISKSGTVYFLKDFELTKKRAGIARSYKALSSAADLSHLFLSNPTHDENSSAHFELAGKCLDALDRNAIPDAVIIKCLYLYTRDEGYPVKEEWFESLSQRESSAASTILNNPLDKIAIENSSIQSSLHSLRNYIELRTDIHLE